MASYQKRLQEFAERYRREVATGPVDMPTVAAWIIQQGLWQPPHRSPVDILAADLAQAMRENYFKDPQGRDVRRKHARHVEEILSDGTAKQKVLWDDITTATPEHIHASLQQRRKGIAADCFQVTTDKDSYNENYNPDPTHPVEISLDFTDDVEEMKQPVQYPEEEPAES